MSAPRPRAAEPRGGDALHRDRSRASSFGDNAELYDRSRPTYPAALIEDLSVPAPRLVLDVGCGTGLLARALVERGVEVIGVEPDERMAAVARRHGIAVEIAPFESWDSRGRVVDLLVSGQAWHWLDPELGARRAAELVGPGGRVALCWNVASMPAMLQERLDAVYASHAEGIAAPTVAMRDREWMRAGSAEDALARTTAFARLTRRSYPWERRYTTEEWIAQLETHSDHHRLDAATRSDLLAAVSAQIDAIGGDFAMRYECEVTLAERA